MRWFLGLVLVVALVTGAAYGVGRFLLPNQLDVTRTTSIARPRAAVFAMVNDLRIAKEWSPYYAIDPDADYAFSGEPGSGQTMRWNSNVREVGRGRMSIVNSIENQEVESILDITNRAALNSRMDLRPGQGTTSVAWTVSAACSDDWRNVPCRYMNLVLRGMIEHELDNGLSRLKTLAEQLPNVNFEGYDISIVPVDSQQVLFVDVSISKPDGPTFADREQAEQDGIQTLNLFITNNQVTRGDGLVRVFPQNNGVNGIYSFSVGYPFTGAAPARLVGVRVGETPSGAALQANFVGRRSQIPLMYQRIDAYRQAHRIALREGTEAWEIVHAVEPADPSSPNAGDPIEHTSIYYPIESSGAAN